MADPKPITIEYIDPANYDGAHDPQPYAIIGNAPGGGGVTSVNAQTGVVVLDAGDVGARPAGAVPWADVSNIPVALTAAQAAGTPSIRAIGTTATTAKAGNYVPGWAEITSKPAVVVALPAALGTPGQVLAVDAAGTGLEWITPA